MTQVDRTMALRRLRRALASLVKRYPRLTSVEAQERAAEWAQEEEENHGNVDNDCQNNESVIRKGT